MHATKDFIFITCEFFFLSNVLYIMNMINKTKTLEKFLHRHNQHINSIFYVLHNKCGGKKFLWKGVYSAASQGCYKRIRLLSSKIFENFYLQNFLVIEKKNNLSIYLVIEFQKLIFVCLKTFFLRQTFFLFYNFFI